MSCECVVSADGRTPVVRCIEMKGLSAIHSRDRKSPFKSRIGSCAGFPEI